MSAGAPAAATNAGIGVSGVEASTRMPGRQLGRVAGDQQVPVGIERADVDAPLAHARRARCAPSRGCRCICAVERRPRRRAVGEQIVAEGVEAGLRMRHRPAGAAAEGVLERAVGRIAAARSDPCGTRARPAGPVGTAGSARRAASTGASSSAIGKAAHEHRPEIGPRPQLLERPRRRVGQVLERHAGIARDALEQLAPGGLDRRRHGVHAGVHDPVRHGWS